MLLATASNIAQYATDSIYYGSFFALISLSLSLLFGVMGLMNFAYGELIMAGAYVMFYTRGWGWLAMIVMTIMIVTTLSLLMELVAFRPLRRAEPVIVISVVVLPAPLCPTRPTSSPSPTSSERFCTARTRP